MSPFEEALEMGADIVDKVLPNGFLEIGEVALRSEMESLDSSR